MAASCLNTWLMYILVNRNMHLWKYGRIEVLQHFSSRLWEECRSDNQNIPREAGQVLRYILVMRWPFGGLKLTIWGLFGVRNFLADFFGKKYFGRDFLYSWQMHGAWIKAGAKFIELSRTLYDYTCICFSFNFSFFLCKQRKEGLILGYILGSTIVDKTSWDN